MNHFSSYYFLYWSGHVPILPDGSWDLAFWACLIVAGLVEEMLYKSMFYLINSHLHRDIKLHIVKHWRYWVLYMMGCYGIVERREENASSLNGIVIDGEEKWEGRFSWKMAVKAVCACVCVFWLYVVAAFAYCFSYLELETWKKITMSGMCQEHDFIYLFTVINFVSRFYFRLR